MTYIIAGFRLHCHYTTVPRHSFKDLVHGYNKCKPFKIGEQISPNASHIDSPGHLDT